MDSRAGGPTRNIAVNAVRDAAPAMLRKTRPIYRRNRRKSDRDGLQPLGTGFFVRFHSKTFFITAAHVARELSDDIDLFVPVLETELVSIPGQFYFSRAPNGKSDDDKIDLAYIELPIAMAVRLPEDNVFTEEDWLVGDRPSPYSHYVVCGWPASRNKPNLLRSTKLPRKPITYHDFCNQDFQFRDLGLNSDWHYALHFNKKRVIDGTGRLNLPPKLQGISGSPVYFFHRYEHTADLETVPTPKLVAIAIEFHAPQKAIVATRLELLLNMLTKAVCSHGKSERV